MIHPDDDEPKAAVALTIDNSELITNLSAEPRSDLTYRLIDGVRLAGRSLHQSLLTGSILRRCTFTEVDLSRCDLDGVRIEGCVFVQCDFTNVDIRSAAVARTTFEKCTFNSAYIADAAFSETEFRLCKFRNAVVASCSFTTSVLSECDIAQSSFMQNRFSCTRFIKMTLGDCTFLYCVLRDCTFLESRISAESIGMTFGLTPEIIGDLGIVYLGQETSAPNNPDERVGALLAEYARRRWLLGVCLLSLVFRRASSASVIGTYVKGLRSELDQGRPLRRDELTFFVTVLEELARDQQLPLMSLVDAIDAFSRLAADPGSESDASHSRLLAQTLVSRLYMLLHSMLDSFEARRLAIEDFDRDETVRVILTFEARPEMELAPILNQIATASGFSVSHPSRMIESRNGSYVEYIEATLLSALAFQMFLFLLNGCIIQMTLLRGRVGVLQMKRLPEAFRNDALQPRQNLPEHLAVPFQKLLGFASALPWFGDPTHKGLTPPNLVEVKVEEPSEASPPAES